MSTASRLPNGFNPRLRMGGDDARTSSGTERWRSEAVSIHASAWEATMQGQVMTRDYPRRFNPRLRMGGDLAYGSTCIGFILKCAFQSTPPHGRRPRAMCGRNVQDVSIHASAWEATPAARTRRCQSTPPHGRRRQMGGDMPRPRLPAGRSGFNPRLRMGGDCDIISNC